MVFEVGDVTLGRAGKITYQLCCFRLCQQIVRCRSTLLRICQRHRRQNKKQCHGDKRGKMTGEAIAHILTDSGERGVWAATCCRTSRKIFCDCQRHHQFSKSPDLVSCSANCCMIRHRTETPRPDERSEEHTSEL